jgi:predicted acyltransferase
LSLDVFRGLTILAMILVNNPGSWDAMYWPLKHAEWHGWTPTDLIFPFFLFIVGTALAYSLRRYRDNVGRTGEDGTALRRPLRGVYWRIVRRSVLLIFLGWLPGLLFRGIGYLSGDETAMDLSTFRVYGVLVRIGLVYFCASMIVLHVPLRGQIVLGIVILLGYWGLLAWLPDPQDYAANLSRDGNLVGLVDRSTVGQSHMYQHGGKTDPEGLLSTLPAVVTALLGYWTGLAIQRRGLNYETVLLLLGCGAICVEIGLLWDFAFPINKKIWTSSYVLLSGGLAMQLLAACILKFDIWGWRRLGRPYEMVGVNAILVFVGSGILATTLGRAKIGSVAVREWLFDKLAAALASMAIESPSWEWLSTPEFASLCYALISVGFWWLACGLLWRLGWQLRV